MNPLPFLDTGLEHSLAPAIMADDGRVVWDYASLYAAARRWQRLHDGRPVLVFLYARNRAEDVAALLGLMAAGHTVVLLDPDLPDARRAALDFHFSPEVVILDAASPPESGVVKRTRADQSPVNPVNSVLLSTSGSTGTPKFVRLSQANLETNGRAIATVLDIRANEVAAAHLPLHYSYGLSVLTSHLASGAPVWLTSLGFMQGAFWQAVKALKAAHLPGVPYHYQMLLRLGLARLPLDTVRVMTQAGGFLDVASRETLWAHMNERGGRFHVLYGQTEAAPRITTLAHEDFPLAKASVGKVLPGGALSIEAPDGSACATGSNGAVVYHGPNVMLGYAEARSDLSIGDVMRGRLETGDIGHVDAQGRLFLAGRTSSFAKVLGLRINLDDLETALALIVPVAILARDDGLCVAYEAEQGVNAQEIETRLKHAFSQNSTISAASLKFVAVEQLPRSARGKVDKMALEKVL